MASSKKTQTAVQLSDKTLNKIKSLQKLEENEKSRNQIIEDAIDFYYGYETAELSQDYLCSVFGQKVEGITGQMSDRMGRLLFKLAVETNVMTRLIADQTNISRLDYDKLRKAAVEDAKSTKGIISVYDA